MDIKKYVITQAVMTEKNELIPIWDDRLVFEKSEMYGNIIKNKNSNRETYNNVVECIYNLKTKQLEIGIELNYYPSEEDLEFKKDEIILFEKSNRILEESKISQIVYEEYEIQIKRGKNIDTYWIKKFNLEKIDENALYAIKNWKPYYVLDNGIKIKWSHQLYHKFDEKKVKK